MRLCRSSLIAKLVILAVMIYATVTLVSLRPKIDDLDRKREILTNEVSTLQQANLDAEADIASLGTDASIMKIARERLQLILEGELIYIDSSK